MRFIVIGDSKGKDFGINEKVLSKLLKQTCKLNPQPELIALLGDNVAGSMEEEILFAQLKRLRDLIGKYHPHCLLIPVVGNHEVNNGQLDERYEKVLSNVYSSPLPDCFLDNYNKTVYYMDFEDTRIIVLNAFHCGTVHKVDREQLIFLREAASTDKKNKIVFVHSPAYPTGAHFSHCLDQYPEDRDAFWYIIDKCFVDIVFSGHEHNYSRRIIDCSFFNGTDDLKRGIYQIITGGGGEKLNNKYKSKKGIIVPPIDKHHFVVVDIIANGINVCAISIDGKKIDEFKINK